MTPTYVIADIGACHGGDRSKMSAAIETAKAVGADALKFQWTSDPREMARRRHDPALEAGYATYLHWPAAWHAELRQECAAAGLGYMCTVFLPQDVDVVAPHVRHFKVSSFEAGDVPLLSAHNRHLAGDGATRFLMVSLGMGTSLAHAHAAIRQDYHWRIQPWYCVSAYPAPFLSLNLRRITRESLVGFSDHTDPFMTWTGALAVMAGATQIEAHLRLETTPETNPDYPHAMGIREFYAYVRHIRFAEMASGSGVADAQPCEHEMLKYRTWING